MSGKNANAERGAMTPPKHNTHAMAFIILAVSVWAAPDTSIQDLSSSDYSERPLKLQELAMGAKCPPSVTTIFFKLDN